MNRYLRIAKEISSKSTHYQHKLGCVIVRKNRIISKGFNKIKTDPKSSHNWSMVHAEFDAVKRVAPEQLKGSIIYIYREHRNGEGAMSRPCPSCYSMLKSLGINKIIYTSEDGIKEELL